MPTISRRWMGKRSATTARRNPRAHHARSRPKRPPSAERTTLSASSWRMRRRASGAERGAHGELALPRRRPRQQQVGDVGARDQQHEGHGAGQDEERRTHVTGQLIAQRDDARRPAGVEVREHLRQSRPTPASSRAARVRRVMPGLQASDDRQRPAARRARLRREANWQPHVYALVEKREAGRHDADDGVRRALRHERSCRGSPDRRRSGVSTADR